MARVAGAEPPSRKELKMASSTQTRPTFSKGTLVAARLAGSNWDFEDVAVVLDVRQNERGEFWTSFVTERGELIAMNEFQARAVFDILPERDESIFVLTYTMMSKWQVEDDHEAGRFAAGFARARASLAGRSLVRRMAVTNSVADK